MTERALSSLIMLLLSMVLSGCVNSTTFTRFPPSVVVPPGAAICTQVFDDKIQLEPNRTLYISGDRCKVPAALSDQSLEEFMEFTFFDGKERVVGRVGPSKPQRINLIEITPRPTQQFPPSIPQFSDLFELAMRQYLVKRKILEIYYFLFGQYEMLPDRT